MIDDNWEHAPNPPQILPGPSNPWLICGGSGGQGGGLGVSKPGYGLPTFPDIDGAGFFGPTYDRWVFMGGAVITVQGFSLLAMGSFAAGAAAAGLAPVGGFMGIAVVGIAVGILAAAAGLAAMALAIDPPVIDYRVKVVPMPRRRMALPPITPPELAAMVAAVVEIEVLMTGQTDLIHRLREAAAVKDVAVYDMHLRDLWAVQYNLQKQSNALAKASKAFQSSQKSLLSLLTLPPLVPLRQMTIAITDMRREVANIGVSPAEQNLVLAVTSLPSPTLACCEGALAYHYKKSKTAAGLLGRTTKDLATVEHISWEAFGGKPV